MDKILISACLIGDNTKYDGTNNNVEALRELLDFYELVPFCPEVEGGLPIPRKRSEIRADRVRDESGADISRYFNSGADKAVGLCKLLGINIAILKENSPSCGVHHVYNGLFSGTLINGKGIAAGRLSAAGITIMNEEEALAFLEELKAKREIGEAKKAEAKARRESGEEAPVPEKPAEPQEKRFEKREKDFKKPFHGDRRHHDSRKEFHGRNPEGRSFKGDRGQSAKGNRNGKPYSSKPGSKRPYDKAKRFHKPSDDKK